MNYWAYRFLYLDKHYLILSIMLLDLILYQKVELLVFFTL